MEEKQQEDLYTRGFNNGYLLAKHEPEIASHLSGGLDNTNPFYQGLIGGKAEYEKEVREWSKSFSKGAPAKEDRDLNRER